jgi:hypothetical protein
MEDEYLNEDDIMLEIDEDTFQESFKKKARW